MPFTVDEDKMQGRAVDPVTGEKLMVVSLDPHNPPVKAIPFHDFPRVMYKHPKEDFKTIEHRNARHELVEQEVVQTEHITLVVKDKADMEKAMKAGWVKEQYIPKPIPSKHEHLYS